MNQFLVKESVKRNFLGILLKAIQDATEAMSDFAKILWKWQIAS